MVKITQDDLTQWFDLCEKLDLIDSFSFNRVTYRKEKRRHGWYWYSYKRIGGKLFNSYCGDKWQLREKIPDMARELEQKSKGEHVPNTSSSKVEAVSEANEWFERWVSGKVGR